MAASDSRGMQDSSLDRDAEATEHLIRKDGPDAASRPPVNGGPGAGTRRISFFVSFRSLALIGLACVAAVALTEEDSRRSVVDVLMNPFGAVAKVKEGVREKLSVPVHEDSAMAPQLPGPSPSASLAADNRIMTDSVKATSTSDSEPAAKAAPKSESQKPDVHSVAQSASESDHEAAHSSPNEAASISAGTKMQQQQASVSNLTAKVNGSTTGSKESLGKGEPVKRDTTVVKTADHGPVSPHRDHTTAIENANGEEHSIHHRVPHAEKVLAKRTETEENEEAPLNLSRGSLLAPLEAKHDGNRCDTTEEEVLQLCYMRCAILTDGLYPRRIDAVTCCPPEDPREHGLREMVHKVTEIFTDCRTERGFCSGFDVDGNGKCPHPPGACFKDEEPHNSLCYKQCAHLNKEYPFRRSAVACCKEDKWWKCGAHNQMISEKFNVGGGTFDKPHPFLVSLTEDLSDHATPEASKHESQAALEMRASREAALASQPMGNLHDHNPCLDNEEPFGPSHSVLCYAKCSLLTHGELPHRKSPSECCDAKACGKKSVRGLIPCTGFNRDGNDNCPRAPGSCRPNEEPFEGTCYEQCRLLTANHEQGVHPYRKSAFKCCKTDGFLECLLPSNANVRFAYAVGGGVRENGMAEVPHMPLKALTESSGPMSREAKAEALEEQHQSRAFKVIAAGNVNVRQAPSMTSQVIDIETPGTIVRGVRTGDWLKLTDRTGYMLTHMDAGHNKTLRAFLGSGGIDLLQQVQD